MRTCISIVVLILAAGCCSIMVSDILNKKDAREKAGTVIVDAADTTLNLFTSKERELLLKYLASSAEWRVTKFGETSAIQGTLVALRRKSTQNGWQTTLHGYVSDFTASILLQSRVMIRLEPYKPGSEDGWIRNGWVDKGEIGDTIMLNLYKPKYEQPGIESYLVIEGDNVWIEIYEQANSEDRNFTQTVINQINQELSRMLDNGFSSSLLPSGSTRLSDSTEIIVDDGMQPGIYDVHGYVNPGEAGWIYFKVFNMNTDIEVMYEMEQKRTIEYVGWSQDPREKFFFDCEAMCKEGDWEHEFSARFEMWFVPGDGEKERLLGSVTRNIYGWQR